MTHRSIFIALALLIAIFASIESPARVATNTEPQQSDQSFVETVKYAQHDSTSLYFDIYRPSAVNDKGSCVVYVFGGGFVMGSRDGANNVPFLRELAARGYTVIAIDYRLGLKGVKKVSPLNSKPVFDAVDLASRDLIAATKYLLDNSGSLGIDPDRLVVIGSSAGAITVLQTDYLMSSRSPVAQILPVDYRYKGVISLAGAVFSTKGKPTYPNGAAPTMMIHGTKDKVVVYDKIRLFNIGMFGTNALVKIFNKMGTPYYAIRYVGSQHEVAEFPREYNRDQICNFIDLAVQGAFVNQIDATICDRYVRENFRLDLTLDQLYSSPEDLTLITVQNGN